MDSFWFVVEYNAAINPFDFVSVDNINNSTSIGIVKDIQSVVIEETPLHSNIMMHISNGLCMLSSDTGGIFSIP